MPDYSQKISGETPFKPEYDEFVREYPGRGSLKVQTSVASEAFPIAGAFVDVVLCYKGKRYSIYHDVTDDSGIVNEIVLPSRLNAATQSPDSAALGEPEYLISIYHPSFDEIIDAPVTIHDRVETILPISLNPTNGQTEG
ncbi:MAG: hypothetical protein IJ598_02930 [Ruminococcus sp.]|nr:hypothetical protein [Ruminococcus sp.]